MGGRVGSLPGPRLVAGGPQIARVGGLRRHPDGVGDLPRLHLVVAEQAGHDRQAGGVGRRPPGRAQGVGTQVPDRPRSRRRSRRAVVGVVELVERARGGVDHDGVAVAGRRSGPLRWGCRHRRDTAPGRSRWRTGTRRSRRAGPAAPRCRACRRGCDGSPDGPKSGCRNVDDESMLASHWALCTSTGSDEMSVFQMLSDGNIGHPARPGPASPLGPARRRRRP